MGVVLDSSIDYELRFSSLPKMMLDKWLYGRKYGVWMEVWADENLRHSIA